MAYKKIQKKRDETELVLARAKSEDVVQYSSQAQTNSPLLQACVRNLYNRYQIRRTYQYIVREYELPCGK